MKNNYFYRMLPYVGTSVCMLVLCAFMHAPTFVGVLLSILPMVAYHRSMYRKKNVGLNQLEIDSIYYFGFLVTIAALAICASVIAGGDGAADLNGVISQFGAGLVATGYAVGARMHLTSLQTVETVTPEEILDQYILRSGEMLTNIEQATLELSRFSQVIVERTVKAAEEVSKQAVEAMEEAADTFAVELDGALADARDSMGKVRSMVADVSFVNEREALALGLHRNVAALSAMNESVEGVIKLSRERATLEHQALGTSRTLNASLDSFAALLQRIGGEQGDLARSSHALVNAAASIDSATESVGAVVQGLGDLAESVNTAPPTFKKLQTLTKKVAEQLVVLGDASAGLGQATDRVTHAAAASNALAAGMAGVAAILPGLARAASGLGEEFADAATATQRLASELAALPEHGKHLSTFGNAAALGIGAISKSVATVLEQTDTIANRASETARAMEGANRLLVSASAMQETVGSLEALFGGLTVAVGKTTETLADASDELGTSMRRARQRLDAGMLASTAVSDCLAAAALQPAAAVDETALVTTGAA